MPYAAKSNLFVLIYLLKALPLQQIGGSSAISNKVDYDRFAPSLQQIQNCFLRHVIKMWYRWTAERGQVNTIQLPVECQGTGGKLPFLHDRT